MLYICIFSNKFDLNQAIHFSDTGAERFLRNPAPYTMYSKITENSAKTMLPISLKQMEGY